MVKAGNYISSTCTFSIGAPQECVRSPLLFSLYTHNCTATHNYNTAEKFTDYTVVVGLIKDNNEAAYGSEVKELSSGCRNNNLDLNVSKGKEMIVDFRREGRRTHHSPPQTDGTKVGTVSSYKCMEDLTWTTYSTMLVKKARQHLYLLRWL